MLGPKTIIVFFRTPIHVVTGSKRIVVGVKGVALAAPVGATWKQTSSTVPCHLSWELPCLMLTWVYMWTLTLRVGTLHMGARVMAGLKGARVLTGPAGSITCVKEEGQFMQMAYCQSSPKMDT